MKAIKNYQVPALLLLLGLVACSNRGSDDAGPAPIDTGLESGAVDTGATPAGDTVAARGTDTSKATPPITPPPAEARDTAAAGAPEPSQPTNQAPGKGGRVTQIEYEGWRQYSVNCARCHGQDVLPNPVAANLLISLGPGGPIDSPEKFLEVVSEGRPERGMPAFKSILTPDQISAIYAYVKGRAEGRIPAGRPERPQA